MLFVFLVFSFSFIVFDYSEADLAKVTSPEELPTLGDGEVCVEGQKYKQDCNTCVCKNTKLLCSKIACVEAQPINIKRENDKKEKKDKKAKKGKKEYQRSKKESLKEKLTVSDSMFSKLPQLPHHASPCTPGELYRVDCNVCICNKKNSLACDRKMCVDRHTAKRIEAEKRSGKFCSSPREFRAKCVTCECNSNKTYCEPIPDCVSETEKMVLSNKNRVRLTFNLKQETCVPNMVYSDECNKCYCQTDKTLRCTSKKCLNYQLALKMEEQKQYLIARGL
ncbi:uncharacterized protein LOC142982557 isoform X2 [Anticarsia gemmatalis]|uniref:uncharacterized protein LOC142982557 isoform X2 n=1 Tax=Anticarsia gemmatalis TaxID=129554 RepID=UPI003F75A5B0